MPLPLILESFLSDGWIEGQLKECSKMQEIDGKQLVEKQKVLLVPNKNTEWFCNLSN